MKQTIFILLTVLFSLSTVSCKDDDSISAEARSAMEAFVREHYPNSNVIKMDRDNSRTEVDIIHNNINKDVFFDLNNNWLYTSWDVYPSALPEAVANIVNNTPYIGYYIDDADFYETPQGNYYLLEVDRGESEVKIRVKEDGVIF